MTRYVWRDDGFYNRATGERMEAPDRVCLPAVISDVTYKSPLSGREITSRSERREEMKVHGVREVDPTEYRPTYRKKENAIKTGGEWNPDAGKPADLGDSSIYKRLPVDLTR
jgi:hypothetical protein